MVFCHSQRPWPVLPSLLEKQGRKKGESASYIVPLTELRPAIRLAFAAARDVAPPKGKTKKTREEHNEKVDIREFHALLVAFRQYIELDVIFGVMDEDGDRKVNWDNCQAFLPLLETWSITEEDAIGRLPDLKKGIGFDDFADWCIRKRFGELDLDLDENDPEDTLKDAANCDGMDLMLQKFCEWDIDKSGGISLQELARVLMLLDKSFTFDMAETLFAAMDTDTNGYVDYAEFLLWLCEAA